MVIFNYVGGFLKYYVKGKQLDIEEYTLFGRVYMVCQNRCNLVVVIESRFVFVWKLDAGIDCIGV